MTDESARSPDEVYRLEVLPELDAVYRFALRLTRDPDSARDLTQDTFLRAWDNRERYEPGSRARSWLYTICRNLFLRTEDRRRRHQRVVSEALNDDPRRLSRESTVFMDVKSQDPEGAFWNNIIDQTILDAIHALPTEFKEVVVLSDLEDLTYQEVADVLGIPVGTVKSRLYRGRRILQEDLYEHAVASGIVPPRPEGADPIQGTDAREEGE